MSRTIFMLLVTFVTAHSFGQTRPLVEISDGKNPGIQGRVESHDKQLVTLMKRSGELVQLKRRAVKKITTVSKRFKPYTKSEMVSAMRDELGRGFTVQTTQHYVVCTAKGTRKNYAAVFENVYKAFHYQFRRRQFQLKQTEFPLVAIVFPNFRDFAAYAQKDGVRASRGLLGYYHRMSNRVAVYESPQSAEKPGSKTRTSQVPGSKVVGDLIADTGSAMSLESTITHETIHQVSFNTGLHPRLGHAPRWVIEGLAMTFEAPGFLSTSSQGRDASRINRSRLVWFKGYSQQKRPKKSLRAFIASGSMFNRAALDAYAQSWALTFFFMDQPARSYKFGRYIRTMNERDLTSGYSNEARVQDFENAFGSIDRLEVDFLRFMDSLDPNSVAQR